MEKLCNFEDRSWINLLKDAGQKGLEEEFNELAADQENTEMMTELMTCWPRLCDV